MKVTLIAGSTRPDASTTKLCHYIAKLLTEQGHEAEVFNLQEHALPLYGPGEAYGHEEVLKLAAAAKSADALVLATPEYHGSLSGVLKNALDFLNSEYFNNKVVLSANSAGGLIGTASLLHLQNIVRNLHGINCPEWISIGGSLREFNENGDPVDEGTELRIRTAVASFVTLGEKLKNAQS
ncbi:MULTISPECIES: NADPH-dependent FMN reductase [Paenibacillus]|uniref:NADPH-dependent FMN reductase n=1 Tax=Paenibacillus TaxID=44249 RepID=UPI00036DB05D|nr:MULTISPECIES: NADPH-dependent FMN reductase [Paenibacillus]